ncbi:MAG: rhombotarget lipoprotein, partial [Gammaproteobacteria bacterium]|nr:rhombotarget lipoprotein [Gammaproteobacteria bacterium]
FLAGCSALWQLGEPYGTRDGVSSSLVDYLYPKGEVPPEPTESIPRLSLPLRVGIAFVPARNASDAAISEATKTDLLGNVKTAFMDRDYIAHIEVIPDTYLRSSKVFEGMQQVARLYGVDVMALVSYDQVSVSEDRKSSFLYWTIVGAYVIKGTGNEVQTFVDTAVFDVATRKLLFRAPGTDQFQSNSTAVESAETIRRGRNTSFTAAVDDMTGNLLGELDRFELRLKEEPQLAEVSWKDGSGGGGMFGGPMLLMLLLFGVRRRKHAAIAVTAVEQGARGRTRATRLRRS